jgi:hypothetical protein
LAIVRLAEILDSPSMRLFRGAAEAVQAAVFVLTVVLGIGGAAYLAASRVAVSRETTFVLILSATVLIAAVCSLGFYIVYVHRPEDYSIVSLHGSLEIVREGAHHRYTYHRRQTVLARRDDIRLVRIRSHWSGKSAEEGTIDSLIPDHILLDGRSPEADGRTYRWVYLREPVGKAHRVAVSVRHVFADDLERMKSYFRESGEGFVTRSIHVCVRFRLSEEPARVNGVVWKSRRRGEPRQAVGLMECTRTVDATLDMIEFGLVVKRPNRNSAYGIHWEWDEHVQSSRQAREQK